VKGTVVGGARSQLKKPTGKSKKNKLSWVAALDMQRGWGKEEKQKGGRKMGNYQLVLVQKNKRKSADQPNLMKEVPASGAE